MKIDFRKIPKYLQIKMNDFISKRHFYFTRSKIHVTFRTGGLFAGMIVRLESIVKYCNQNKKHPLIVNSSRQFHGYKSHSKCDLTSKLFEPTDVSVTLELSQLLKDNGTEIRFSKANIPEFSATSRMHYAQFTDYSEINYSQLKPILNKYFRSSNLIKQKINTIESDVNTEYKNLCAVRYRSSDKATETNQPTYKQITDKMYQLEKAVPEIVFYIETDNLDFLQYAKKSFGSKIFSRGINNVRTESHAIDLYASIEFMSKCKYGILTSGNSELYLCLLRGNNKNIIQWLDNKPNIYGEKNPLPKVGKWLGYWEI
jgi:hypothetical protein